MKAAFLRSPVFVLICAVGIILFAYGGRQSMGMFLRPVTEGLGWGADIRVMSFATGLQLLIYGCAAPLLGAAADRWGPIRVLILSGLLYAYGLYMMSQSTTEFGLVLNVGIIMGLGSAGIALPMLLSIVGRVAPEKWRTFWLGIVVSGGTAGQMLIVPLSHYLISSRGWVFATIILATMALMVVPFSFAISRAAKGLFKKKDSQSLGDAIKEAGGHGGFWLLTIAFFVCGFQVQFINNHLENYLNSTAVGGAMAATAIAFIGFFNMLGTQASGFLGGFMRQKYLLAFIYSARSLVFLAFFLAPKTEFTVILFASSVGLLWLATVPLTSGIVAQVFGPRYLATLYGVVFLSHQIGSFTSVWLGGIIKVQTGSYDYAWWMIIGSGIIASILHLPINDKPVPRLVRDQPAKVSL